MPHGSMEFCTSNKDLRRIVSVKPGLVTSVYKYLPLGGQSMAKRIAPGRRVIADFLPCASGAYFSGDRPIAPAAVFSRFPAGSRGPSLTSPGRR